MSNGPIELCPESQLESSHLAFGIKMVIPVKIGLLSRRVGHFDESSNLDWQLADLDLIDETREWAHLKMMAYQ